MDREEFHNNYTVSVSRLRSLSDGVVAIVITLLILDIRFPIAGVSSNKWTFLHHLLTLVPNIYAYVLSFLVIAKYWQLHTLYLKHLRYISNRMLWYNFYFLLSLSFLPFPTSTLGRYTNQFAVIMFDISVVLPMLIFSWMCSAAKDPFYLDTQVTSPEAYDRFIGRIRLYLFLTPIFAFLSIVLSFYSVWLATYCWLIFPVLALFLKHAFFAKDHLKQL